MDHFLKYKGMLCNIMNLAHVDSNISVQQWAVL